MRILHVVHRYWPAVGGTEKFFQEISERFARDGHEVHVYTTDAIDIQLFWQKDKSRVKKYSEEYNRVNIQRFCVKHFPLHTKVVKLLSLIPWLNSKGIFSSPSPLVPELVAKTQTEVNFDIVHAAALPYDSIISSAFKMARRKKAPFVISPFFHIGEGKVHERYNRSYQLRMVGESDKVFAQTNVELAYLRSQGLSEEKTELLGMGINPSELEGGEATLFRQKYDISTPIIFYIGPKTYDKGTHHLVEAMRQLWSQGLEATLVLAGATIDDFEEYFNKLPLMLKKKCLLLGHISEQEKNNLLAASDVFVMPSRIDSFGIVYLEAWFNKKPVIGAAAGGVVDVISDGVDGFLVPFGDVEALSERIRSLVQDKQLAHRLGQSGYNKVMGNYTWDKKYAIVKKVYEQLVSKESS